MGKCNTSKNGVENFLIKQNTANGFTAPFLIRAYYTGGFNIDTGIITSLTFSKGKEGSWVDGVPTEVDVSLTIKDLYSNLSMPVDTGLPNNTAMMDYIGNAVGNNIMNADYLLRLQTYKDIIKNKIMPGHIMSGLQLRLENAITNYHMAFEGVFGASRR